MKKITYVLVAVLMCVAGFAAPGWTAINITPSTTYATTGQSINFAVQSGVFLGVPPPPSTCFFTWLYGDEITPVLPQAVLPGTCTPTSARSYNCSNNLVHTYQHAGTYTYAAEGTACNTSWTITRGTLTVACPTLSFGGCAAFSTACFPPPLPNADQGKAYSFNFATRTSGGKGSYSYVATSALPAGLSLSSTGVLSGTPSVNGIFAISVTASDSCTRFSPNGAFTDPQTVSQTFRLTINPCPAVAMTSANPLPVATSGVPYAFTFSGTGMTPITFSAGFDSPPPGLSWNGITGSLSGTPSVAGNYTLPVNVVDSCSPRQTSPTINYALRVNCPLFVIDTSRQLTPAVVGQQYSRRITQVGGVSPVTFAVSGGALPPGMSLSADGLISGTPSNVGKYSFNVSATDSCPLGARTVQKSFDITVDCTQLRIPQPYLAPGTVGKPYSYQIETTGGQTPYVFSLSNGFLPDGLSLSPSGIISGVPRADGRFRFTVSVEDHCPVATQMIRDVLTMDIATPAAVCMPFIITSPAVLPNAVAGQSYALQIQTSGGTAPVSLALTGGSLPPGLGMTPEGLITGMPAVSTGTYSFTVTATDSCPAGPRTYRQNFTLQVQAAPVVCPRLSMVSQSPLPAGKVNQGYAYQLLATGGQSPMTFRLVGGALPQGLTLTSSGLISGIPAAGGSYTATIRTEDSCPGAAQVIQTAFTVQIDAPPTPGAFAVAASPANLSVARGSSSVGRITYTLTGDPSLSGIMTSTAGTFLVGDEPVGTNPSTVAVNMVGGSAVITEQVLIPVTVIERALQRGSALVTYRREFTGQGGAAATALVSLNITTEAAAGFALKRMDLYFNDHRPEITVPRLSRELKAFVELDYAGTGPLEAYWEVDNRVIAFVSRPVTFGGTLVLESPLPPTLPTSDTGYHVVRFVVTSPATDLPMPVATYFVTPEEGTKRLYLNLKTPEDKAALEPGPQKFTWESSSPAAAYEVIFQAPGEKEPVFSAFVREMSYQLSGSVLKGRFTAGKIYRWKVQAIDAGGNLIGESRTREVTFGTSRGYVPGQILVAVEDKAYSDQFMSDLAAKYRLKVLETFELKSILMRLAVFESPDKDIFKIIAEMQKDDRIQMVQPNYVMTTHAAGPKVPQYADTVVRLDRIPASLRGHGVRIALIDTGVDSSHPDLKGKVAATRNFVGPEGYRAEIHGTAVAGVIAGGGIGVKGIAPEAEVLALRACRQSSDDAPEAECFTSSLARALDDAIRSDARIVNMSFGAAQNDPLLSRLISAGAGRKMIFVAPAGNAAGDRELRFPASHPDVVAVAGFDDRNRPYPNGDLSKKALAAAPAVDVFTSVPGGRYNFLTGTSLSAGYVTGLISLAAEQDQALTKAKVPRFQGNFCRWEEELLKISICGR